MGLKRPERNRADYVFCVHSCKNAMGECLDVPSSSGISGVWESQTHTPPHLASSHTLVSSACTLLWLKDRSEKQIISASFNRTQTRIHINCSHMVAEHGPDAPVPQMAEQLLEVPKIISQCRILQQTLDILVPQVVEEILEVIKVILQERISERTAEQIVDVSGSESLAATLASEVASKNSCAHVTADHEVSAEELKTLAEATQVLQSEACGADGQMYSLFQENSSVACQTSTDLKGFDMGTVVRQLAEQEHSAALAQRGSRVSEIMKFGAGADNDLFVKVKDLIMDLIRLQTEASHETNQKSHCDEEKLLSVVYKNAVDNRRAAWRVITSVEQKKTSKGDEQLVSNAREYVEKVEGELQKIRDGILALMDKKLVPSASTDEEVITTDTLPSLQQARQRAKPAKAPVTLVSKPTRSPRTIWL